MCATLCVVCVCVSHGPLEGGGQQINHTWAGSVHTGARRLRLKGREAKEGGADATDYKASPTARSFVPYHAQRLSATCVVHGARAIQKSLKRMAARRRPAPTAA